ncbi:MAG: prefoldin subunit alpha [Candidatus Thermoplasmatota archaeon]
MATEQEITRNMTLLEYYKEQLNTIDIQMQMVQAAMADMYKAKMTVESIQKTAQKSEILIPIGGGVYLQGMLGDTSKVLVGVGADIVIEKTSEDAVKKIDERIQSLSESQQKLLQMGQRLEQEAAELSKKTQKMIDETKM